MAGGPQLPQRAALLGRVVPLVQLVPLAQGQPGRRLGQLAPPELLLVEQLLVVALVLLAQQLAGWVLRRAVGQEWVQDLQQYRNFAAGIPPSFGPD